MAAEIKKHVNIPIIAVCNIKEPDVAEEILVEGCCDFVGVARGHLADPEWCNKAHAGKAQTIRKCIGCLSCFQEIESQRHVKCVVNPKLGREREFENPKHNGQGLVDGLIAQVSASDIELRMGEEATIDKVKALSPCGIFVACGAIASMPPIPGIDGKNVVTAEDVLIGKAQLKGDCIILGSGMTGLETAEVVLKAGHRTTIVDMLHEIGQGVPIEIEIGGYNEPLMEAGFADLVPGASADGYCFLFKYDICSGKDDNVILQNATLLGYDSVTDYRSWEAASIKSISMEPSLDDPWSELVVVKPLGAAYSINSNWVRGMHALARFEEKESDDLFSYLFAGRYDRSTISPGHQRYGQY